MARAEGWSLQRRMLLGLLGFAFVLSVLVFSIGNHVHEHAEHAAWRSLLASELASIQSKSAEDPGYRWQDSDTLRLYPLDQEGPVQAQLRQLHDGLHDGVEVQGRLSAVMIRTGQPLGRLALVLDIADFHELESSAERSALLAGLALILLTGLAAWIGVGRLVRPLSVLADDIGRLRPGGGGQRVGVAAGGSPELHVIADALNAYIQRNVEFVERERAFLATTSHELRTPVAVIGGAAELALEQPGLPPRAADQVRRVKESAQGMERLIQLLLVLAREPARLAAMCKPIDLAAVVRQVIEDHRHLPGDRQLQLQVGALASCTVLAPPGVAETMIGNLLRNAIENSGSGTIMVSLGADACVTIDDPGQGMSPEQLAAIHARLARRGGPGDTGNGIGLELIARLCEHLGWDLRMQSLQPRGTRARLRVGRVEASR